MWTFSTLLPLIIGDLVPNDDQRWECFLLLLEIVKHCTSRVTSPKAAVIVAVLVDQHHQSFRKCYPGTNITPKMHYMVHFLEQLLRFAIMYNAVIVYISTFYSRTGPMVVSWCMRMEAKNSYFKKIARIGNFPYSVAKRHQRLLCAYLQGQFFTHDEDHVGDFHT